MSNLDSLQIDKMKAELAEQFPGLAELPALDGIVYLLHSLSARQKTQADYIAAIRNDQMQRTQVLTQKVTKLHETLDKALTILSTLVARMEKNAVQPPL